MLLCPGTRTSRKEPDISTWTLSVWHLSRDGLMLLVMLVFVMAEHPPMLTATQPLSGYSCVSFSGQAGTSFASVSVNGRWLLCLVNLEHRQVQTTGTCGADKPFISLSLKNSHI